MAVALSVTGVKQSIVTASSGAVKLGKEAEPERSFWQTLTCSPASALIPASERRTLWSGLTFEVKQGADSNLHALIASFSTYVILCAENLRACF
jgi:hypothetical protein